MGIPPTALRAVTWPRLLISGWPWRAAGYLLGTLPVALATAAVLAIPAVPWLVLATRLSARDHRLGYLAFLTLLGAALVAALAPLIGAPLAGLERRRLRLVDHRGLTAPQTSAAGRLAWLRGRYTSPVAWREAGYAVLLAVAGPLVTAAALLAVLLTGILVTSPFLVLAQQPGSAPVSLGVGHAATVAQTVPYLIAGLIAVPLLPYLLAVLAGGQAATARALLSGGMSAGLRTELAEVSRSRARLADAFAAERRRIERDLHDGAQQKLVSLTLQLGLARLDLPPGSPAAQNVAAAHEQAKQLMAELRELIHGIQPQILTDLGLAAALSELAEAGPVEVTVDAPLTARLPSPVENTAYFVVAEALTNIAKHSGASSATVTARQDGSLLAVEVSDNGHGGADPRHGTGLTGLADRAAVAGGRMLLSSPPGGPTRLRVELPCR